MKGYVVSCGGFCWTVQWSGIGTERTGKGPVTERYGRAQKNTDPIPVKKTGIRPVMTGIGPVQNTGLVPVFSPVRYGSVTGLFFEKRSSTALFKQDRYWTGIDRYRTSKYWSDTGPIPVRFGKGPGFLEKRTGPVKDRNDRNGKRTGTVSPQNQYRRSLVCSGYRPVLRAGRQPL